MTDSTTAPAPRMIKVTFTDMDTGEVIREVTTDTIIMGLTLPEKAGPEGIPTIVTGMGSLSERIALLDVIMSEIRKQNREDIAAIKADMKLEAQEGEGKPRN